jgi:prevent-host-death family protein
MDKVVNIHEAKTHLSRLLERVQAGEEITIAKAGKPIAQLVPVAARAKKRPIGMDRGKIFIREDFDDPLPEFEPDYGHPEDPLGEPAR